MKIPQLCFWVDGKLKLIRHELLLDIDGWKLTDYPPILSEDEFVVDEKSESFLMDITDNPLAVRFLGSQVVLDFDDSGSNWTESFLCRWLSNKLFQNDIKQEDLLEFIRQIIGNLSTRRNIPLGKLVRSRFLLANVIDKKIKYYRELAYKAGYQKLFAHKDKVETSYQFSFVLAPEYYPTLKYYSGSYVFQKHYPSMIGAFDSDEEFECAKIIDQNDYVKQWVRNVSDQRFSFKLPLSNEYFYPDFVAELIDGRILVVEYNDGILLNESQNIGQLWEERSSGKCLFLLAENQDDKGMCVCRQLADKIKFG